MFGDVPNLCATPHFFTLVVEAYPQCSHTAVSSLIMNNHERISEARLNLAKTRLYGRDQEIKTIRESYERVEASKQTEIILLKGYSGSGKSALASTLQELLSAKGFYISGKFEKMGSAIPHLAIVEAFTTLCKLISSSEQAETIKKGLQSAIAPDDQLILSNVLPTISTLFKTDLSTCIQANVKTEWRFERLKQAFRDYIQSLTEHQLTIVLFIDDLQWADTSSLELLNAIITDETTNLLFVGAYRSNEVDRTHPLHMQLREISKHEIPTKEISVTNLDVESVNGLIAEATRSPPSYTLPLAEIVHQKTNGNAFFTVQFLRMLQAEEMLYMSSKSFLWEWNADRIVGDTDISDNVVELVARKIKRLPDATVKALQIGACLGSRFHVKAVSAMMNESSHTDTVGVSSHDGHLGAQSNLLSEALTAARNEGLITHRHHSLTYKFAHDKIQQSAYSLIVDDAREELHLRIGRQLQEMRKSPELEEQWMHLVLVDQLNRGSRLIVDEEGRVELAQLNLEAAEKAISQSAFFPAAEYLKAGLDLMKGLDGWRHHYKLQLSLCTLLAEAKTYIGDFKACDSLVDVVLENATKLEDKHRVFVVKLESLGSQERLGEALDAGYDMLAQLGETFPRKITRFHVIMSFIKATRALRGKSDEDLLSLPILEDKEKLLALKIVSVQFGIAYLALRPNDSALLCLRLFLMSFEYGLNKYSAYAFAIFGYMKGISYDFDEAYRFGQLAEKLMDRFQAKECDTGTLVVVNTFLAPLRRPLQGQLDSYLKAAQYGMEMGNINEASMAANLYVMMYFCSGLPLGPLLEDSTAFSVQIDRYGQETSLSLALVFNQTILNLMGRSDNPVVLTGSAMNQDEFLSDTNSSNIVGKVQSVWYQLNQLGFYFGDMEVASKYGEMLWNRKKSVDGSSFIVPVYLMFVCLTAMEMSRRTRKRKYHYNARKHTKELTKWLKKQAFNVQHKLSLVLAVKATLGKHDPNVVREMFDEAIRTAKRTGFTQDAALACEVAGRYFVSIKDEVSATSYLTSAMTLYDDWGAQGKVDHLEREYKFLSNAGCNQMEGTSLRGRQRFSTKPSARHLHFNPFRSTVFSVEEK